MVRLIGEFFHSFCEVINSRVEYPVWLSSDRRTAHAAASWV
jgi:hypothetical protein